MLEKYRTNIAELGPDEIDCIVNNLKDDSFGRMVPHQTKDGMPLDSIKQHDPETLYEWANSHGLGHHDIVAVVSQDQSMLAFNLVEKLLGKPIERVHPKIPKTVIRSVGQNVDASIVQDKTRIRVLVEGNPKRRQAAIRFSWYENGMTVSEYYAKGGRREDIIWDRGRGWIDLVDPAEWEDRMK